KVNLETIESLKSKGFESSETAIFESENQSENDCLVVENECDKKENSKVITPEMYKLSVSQSVSQISMSKTSCDSKNVDNLDTFSSVKRPKHSSVVWKKKGSSNTSNVDLSVIVQICIWIIDSRCSKHMTGNRALLTNSVEKFLGTVRFGNNDFAVIAGYGDVIVQICIWIIDSGCSKHMKGNHALLMNFVENFLGTVRFGNNVFVVIVGYGEEKTQVNLQLHVQHVRTDNGMEFKNKTLAKFFDEVGITQQFSAARTPQQNGVVERRNRTLVEAARTMHTFAKLKPSQQLVSHKIV
nr:retrotransposon protein, putative, unclassified [Tanacetum cinerariifolium]